MNATATPPSSSRPPGVHLMRNLGLEPDPWQVEVLEAGHPRLLLNCSRQAGKSTVVAMLGLAEAIFVPFKRARIVELRGALGPGGAHVYRVRVRRKPTPKYIEVREDQLVLIPVEG